MQVQQNEDGILGIDDTRRTTIDGPRQSKRTIRLADLYHCQTSQIVPWIWEFLPKIYQEVFRTGAAINNLLKNNIEFEWTEECQKAFDTLKKRFMEEPVLMMPDQTRPFQIKSDASKHASGAVLTQTNSNGDRHPVVFMSQTFTDTEKRYEIYDRGLLGIIRALKEW
jgi:hypothetical protein